MNQERHRWRAVWIVRDVVEVLAILIAGIWAFYTFAYENRIKPSFANPELNFVVTMERLSRHAGLIGVRLHTEIHNVGTVHANIVGLSYWVLGKRVELARHARAAIVSNGDATLSAFYTESAGTPVFGVAYVTHMADLNSKEEMGLDPGNEIAHDAVFFVPAGRFDYLEAHLAARFTKEDRPTPTAITFDARGIPVFKIPPNRPDVDINSAPFNQLDLNGE
jgi:hypothetical protein